MKSFITMQCVALFAALCLTPALALAQPADPPEEAKAAAPAAPEALAAAEAPKEAPKPEAAPATTEPEKTPAETLEDDPIGFLGNLVQAIRGGQWQMVVAFMLVCLVYLARRFGEKIEFFRSDRGGPILVFSISFAGSLGASMLADSPIDAKLFLTAAEVALMAMGGFVGLRRVLWPQPTKELPTGA